MRQLDGKTAFISGAGSGIGKEAALLFARDGAKVMVADLSRAAGEGVVAQIKAEGGDALFVETDVGDAQSVAQAVAIAVEAFGGLDVVYNNAGGTVASDGPIVDASVDGFWSSLRVNLFGTWLVCKMAVPHLMARGGGSIINTASMAGVIGIPPFHGYAAAKGGVVAMTRSLAAELAPLKIRVNAIAPGMTATDRLRQGLESGRLPKNFVARHGLGLVEPTTVASMALFLASDQSMQITGQTMRVDSGASTAI